MSGSIKEARLGLPERLLRGFAYCLVHTVQRPDVRGVKPPLDEPTIFACNHVGLMDPVVLMVEYYDMMVRPLVAKDYFEKNAFTRHFYPIAQCIPIDRRKASTQWLQDSISALQKGESLIIYPEGTRNKAGSGLLPFHTGTALLAAESGARIVPVYNAMWHFPHRYRLAIGEPLRLGTPGPGKPQSEWLREQTEKIRSAIAALEEIVKI